jgi:hypothetical protein
MRELSKQEPVGGGDWMRPESRDQRTGRTQKTRGEKSNTVSHRSNRLPVTGLDWIELERGFRDD